MKVVGKPVALPGSCLVCNSASREAYIDLGFSLEFHGALYVCRVCVSIMAQQFGFLEPEQGEVLQLKIENLESQNYFHKERFEVLKGIVDGSLVFQRDPDSGRTYISSDRFTGNLSDVQMDARGTEEIPPGEERSSEQTSDKDLARLRPVDEPHATDRDVGEREPENDTEFTLGL